MKELDWSRELNGPSNRTTSVKAEKIKNLKKVDKEVRKGTDIDLPVLAYYATGRLFDEARENKNSKDKKIEISSKFRAYKSCFSCQSLLIRFLKNGSKVRNYLHYKRRSRFLI